MNKMRLISHYKGYVKPELWDDNSDIYAITDDFVDKIEYKSIPKDKKVALMVEPRCLYPSAYEYLEKHYDEYKYIFTFDDVLLKLPNAKLMPYATWWCLSDEPKSKGVSMICSEKAFVEGHRKRQEVARKLYDEGLADVMGKWNGGDYVDTIEAFRDYKFNVAMENDLHDYYFTEKLCNCLANKVVPIYYGARKIGEFFDMDGIIYVEDRDKIPDIIRNLDIDKEYAKRKKAIDKNFELVKQYECYDDCFFAKYGDLIEEMFK